MSGNEDAERRLAPSHASLQSIAEKGKQIRRIKNPAPGKRSMAAGAVYQCIQNLFHKSEGEAMSNRLFQGVIHQMRDAIDRTIGVVDETSVIIACSELGRMAR